MRNGLIRKEVTVPQCICHNGTFNPQCPYVTQQQIKNFLDGQKDPAYDNLPNPEDLI